MRLLSLFTPGMGGSSSVSKGAGNSLLNSVPPDERPSHVLRRPMRREAVKHEAVHHPRNWTPETYRRFNHGIRKGEHGYTVEKNAEAIKVVLDAGSGANHEYSRSEVQDTARKLRNDHLKLGLTGREADSLAEAFEQGPTRE